MKYIIKLNGRFVNQFTKRTVCVTDEINKAGRYSLKVAMKHIEGKKLKAELIEA
jgi:hypothetical protein